jgi:hypothetical protein
VTKHVIKPSTDHMTGSAVSTSKVQADDGSWIPSTYRDFVTSVAGVRLVIPSSYIARLHRDGAR